MENRPSHVSVWTQIVHSSTLVPSCHVPIETGELMRARGRAQCSVPVPVSPIAPIPCGPNQASRREVDGWMS